MGIRTRCAGDRRFKYLLLTFLLPLNLSAQSVKQDSLQTVADSLHAVGDSLISTGEYSQTIEVVQKEIDLRRRVTDSEGEVKALNQIGRAFNGLGTTDSALFYADKVLSLADTTRDSAEIGQAYHTRGYAFAEMERYEKAISEYQIAVNIRLAHGDSVGAASSLNNIGNVYKNLGDYQKALENHEKALEIRLKVLGAENPLVAATYYNIGVTYNYPLDNYDKAQDYYKKALESYYKDLDIKLKSLGPEHPDVAIIYNDIGNIYHQLRNPERALEYIQKALDIRLKSLGPEHLDVAQSYFKMGVVYERLNKFQKALENHERALEIRLKMLGSDHLDVALSYGYIGRLNGCIRNYQDALKSYQKKLEIILKAFGAEHPRIADCYESIAEVYQSLCQYQKALDYYQKALEALSKASGLEYPDVAEVYKDIGKVYNDLGDYQKALEYHHKALKVLIEALGPEHPDVGESYRVLGYMYGELGNHEKRDEYLQKSLDIKLKDLEPESMEWWDYGMIGIVYFDIGDYEKALEYEKKTLDIKLKTLGPKDPSVAISYGWLASIYRKLDDNERALEYSKKELDINLKVFGPEHPRVALDYYSIGGFHISLGNYQKALEYLQKSLDISLKSFGTQGMYAGMIYSYGTGGSVSLTDALIEDIGQVYMEMGAYDKALKHFQRALNIRLEAIGEDNPRIATSYLSIGKAYQEQGELDSALVYYKKSIEVFEESRGRLKSEELRVSYTETVTDRYESIISLLLDMQRYEEAFEYMERSKSASLKKELDETYDIDFGQGTIQEKIEEARRLATKTNVLESQLIEEQQKADSLQNQTNIENLSTLLADTKAEYLKVAAEVRTDPDYAFTVQVHPTDLGSISKDLPAGQKLLMFYSGENELYLFLISPGGEYEVRSVDAGRDSVTALIHTCREFCGPDYLLRLLRSGKMRGWTWEDDDSELYAEEIAPFKEVLTTLYSLLIQPLEEELEEAEIVTFIPSGELYYLPWGALMDDDNLFLTERYNWNLLTSTELLECIFRKQGKQKKLKSLALVGNPKGIDPPLPSAEAEVTSIGGTYRKSKTYIGNSATEPQVIKVSPDVQALHLATHCVLKSDNPLDSYIHLASTDSTDGHWTVEEVWGQSWDKMQLVTLSACQTALGGEQPGLEFVSMAKAFSLAMEGPPAIVATLWSVADESTKEFMITFYEELKDNPKSEALRKAQYQLIHSEYAHPFFWAPFILIGEWR
ncbi:tetratricopeptide repeat protein [candidate division WOR-3 bacterium]|uniref:Tetratricopeptide repeat protein n=1 Tax=candidate division WOR-3 bacterium TaxID=2052148 RepID=A0A9D5K9M4_UNCW3|nr:tetratricopeptide repeat protein [candidate division WOR-3 bacterium]MBD3364972.1 tetratricopeptide repeat protein [candidate division WOR-3 bacterium]